MRVTKLSDPSRQVRNLLLTAFLVCGLCACTSLPPEDYQARLQADYTPENWLYASQFEPITQQFERDIFAQIHSEELRDLIRQALQNNLDLRSNRLSVLASALASRQVDGQLLPELQLQSQAGRDKQLYDGEPSFRNEYGIGLLLEWELDLWGRIRHQRLAQRAELEALQIDYRGARQSVIGLVTRTYLGLWQLDALQQLEARRLEIFTNLQQITEEQYLSGLTNQQDWLLAALKVRETQARLRALQEQHQATGMQLSLLLGEKPGQLSFSASLPDVSIPLVSVPATVLANRPDVQAAFQRLQAKHYEKTAMYRALLPDISLSANTARQTDRLSRLSGAETVWALVGVISQSLMLANIIDAGPLSLARAGSLQEQAERQRYLQVVLDAIVDVENFLLRERSLTEQQQYLKQAVELADGLYIDYQQRYQSGLVSLLDLLNIQEQSLAATEALLDNQFEQVNNRILLGLALGMGGPEPDMPVVVGKAL
ncbi:TolC family protein [Nitrincola sp. MINF-07-Sa-05]|uniref:TolC family protein n=1 Tax=Nitrincola salilacus TaxID=3400273 RepID=UPI003917E634